MQKTDPVSHGLPHREPFIFIDSVLGVPGNGKACCTKIFKAAEPFFRGHFPGDPLVPGVILTEALAQTAGIAAGQCGEGKSYRLSAIKLMKFLYPVRPEEVVMLEAGRMGVVGGLHQYQVQARVGEKTVADGVIVLSEG